MVLLGVITIIFCIYIIKPGDPASLSGGQNTNKDIVENFNKEWGLEQSIPKRYVLFLNDISPLSIHNTANDESLIFYDQDKYKGFKFLSISPSLCFFIKGSSAR